MVGINTGAPGGSRTPNLLIRSQALCPIELRARSELISLLIILITSIYVSLQKVKIPYCLASEFIYHIVQIMNSLETKLDMEVIAYLTKIEDMPEVKALLSGTISKAEYATFLKTFYIIEYISQRAVNLASEMTREEHPYLSKRFDVCAKGELGHAEIALEDLEMLGVGGVEINQSSVANEYDTFLQDCARDFPLGILGHSYLFENASGAMFPKHKPMDFPSRFVEVHAKEDPGHSIAIKRTIRHIENDISSEDQTHMISFAKQSGEYLLRVFDTLKS